MYTLFEIPIYAMDKKSLYMKYINHVENFRRRLHQEVSEETFQRCVDIETYPQRSWAYNHVVGVITIIYWHGEICFKVYLPWNNKERYVWTSRKKTFLYDISVNGMHFCVKNTMNNQEIQQELENMLCVVIKEHVPKKYYVDRRAFDNIKSNIDYRKIIKAFEGR